ncbi:MAG TPA: gephyrin-like molybdotransferase Glp [Nitriliruptorales bacterium]
MTGSDLVPVEQVLAELLDAVDPLGTVRVPVRDALGAVAAVDITAAVPQPRFDNAAMDGFAIRAADTSGASVAHPVRLELVGESFAGAGHEGSPVGPTEAVTIATGAPLPAGADTIVRVEHSTRRGPVVLVHAEVRRGTDVRRTGEDLRAGDVVVPAGSVFGPGQLAAAAGCGHAELTVQRRPRVAVALTGDEVVRADTPGGPLAPHAVHDAVGPALAALLCDAGSAPVTLHGPLQDDAGRLRETLSDLADQVDLLITVGGVSKGVRDHLPTVLGRLGPLSAGNVALRPGKPFRHGRIGATVVLCLPGNPGAALVAAQVFARPVVALQAGHDATAASPTLATLSEPFSQPTGCWHWVRARVTEEAQGPHVRPAGAQGSAMLHSLAAANAWMVVPPDVSVLDVGAEVQVVPTWGDRGRATWRPK